MGREAAMAIARWPALLEPDLPKAKLLAVADVNPAALEWYRQIEGVETFTDYWDVLKNPEIEVVYVAVPHNLHEQIYVEVLEAGKDLFAEKPFGIDLPACERIIEKIQETGRFVRCSSEFPFYPLVQKAYRYLLDTDIGIPIGGRCAFLHSSDLDPNKPINWKRQVATCGEAGVMNDLGLHVCHLPFRLGIKLEVVGADLQKVFTERPDGSGGMAPCDTWDNATVRSRVKWHAGGKSLPAVPDQGTFPFVFETKRIAPGETNTWEFEMIGSQGGVRVSTKHPKTFWRFEVEGSEQRWVQTDVGSESVFKTITGGIFETGFSDAIIQMWAAFVAERAGILGERFGCARPVECLQAHRLFRAALDSNERNDQQLRFVRAPQ